MICLVEDPLPAAGSNQLRCEPTAPREDGETHDKLNIELTHTFRGTQEHFNPERLVDILTMPYFKLFIVLFVAWTGPGSGMPRGGISPPGSPDRVAVVENKLLWSLVCQVLLEIGGVWSPWCVLKGQLTVFNVFPHRCNWFTVTSPTSGWLVLVAPPNQLSTSSVRGSGVDGGDKTQTQIFKQ